MWFGKLSCEKVHWFVLDCIICHLRVVLNASMIVPTSPFYLLMQDQQRHRYLYLTQCRSHAVINFCFDLITAVSEEQSCKYRTFY